MENKTVRILYCVQYGRGDAGDWTDAFVSLTPEEALLYDRALASGQDPNTLPALKPALDRARAELEEQETQAALDNEEEFALECMGLCPMDPDELNDLIADRDPDALSFFGLSEEDEDELDEWDAYDQDELPTRRDLDPSFTPVSPFGQGWTLLAEFAPPEEE